ncbi:14374_t:CDS:2, partial [Dentiscutata erythropus]
MSGLGPIMKVKRDAFMQDLYLELSSEQILDHANAGNSSWCLKEKQKKSRVFVKCLTPQVKSLLETIFYTGTASPRNKLLATEMQQELLNHSQKDEINKVNMPKVSTISNWISSFSKAWKQAMAGNSLEENNPN